jgi:uncharacterized surface protein with fasciclin (FAS1) repeats
MRRRSVLLLLALALALGMAVAEKHGDGPGEETTTTTEKSTADPAGGEAGDGSAGDAGAADAEMDAATTGGGEMDTDAAFEEFMAQQGEAVQPNEVTRFLAEREDTSIFLMLLDHAGMSETLLDGDRQVTIFVPNDAAFGAMDRLQFSTMLNDRAALRRVLERHVALDRLDTADLDARLGQESVAGGGPGEKAAAARPDPAEIGGVDATAATEEMDAAAPVAPSPAAFVRVSTRAGQDIEIGRQAASRRAAAFADTDAAGTAEVAGGGAAGDEGAGTAVAADGTAPGALFVGDARIVEPDLSAGATTVHIVDAVLLPPMEEEPAE